MKKHNVLYSISCIFALLLVGISSLILGSKNCYAYDSCPDGECGGTASDSGTITAVTAPTVTTTASLSLSKTSLKSDAITPGSIATVSTDVTVEVGNATSYSLTLKMDKANLTNGGTTIKAGNVVDDNTWGYKWDNATTYTAPSTNAQTLATPALSNSATNFTKTLTFATKFASNADPGTYHADSTLSLIATPKTAVATLANLTQMQQLAEGYTPDACANTTIPAGKDYAGPYTLTDVRDNNTYTVYKFKDGKCWMTQNLKLSSIGPGGNYSGGRVLKNTTSDISASTWTLPASNAANSTASTVDGAYYSQDTETSYYTWCTAVAGSCGTSGNAISTGDALSSVCPKGWRLPSGGTDTSTSDFGVFITKESIENSALGLAKIQGPPYNFSYTGYMVNGSLSANTSQGRWWSRTAAGSSSAYYLYITNEGVYPANYLAQRMDFRGYGRAVRCVAE